MNRRLKCRFLSTVVQDVSNCVSDFFTAISSSISIIQSTMSVSKSSKSRKASAPQPPLEPLQTTVIPPYSPLKDPLDQSLPFYTSRKPLPPPIPLHGNMFTNKLRFVGDPPAYDPPKRIPFDFASKKTIDSEAAERAPRNGPLGEGMSNKGPGDLLRGYYRRSSWVWAGVGVFGLLVGGMSSGAAKSPLRLAES